MHTSQLVYRTVLKNGVHHPVFMHANGMPMMFEHGRGGLDPMSEFSLMHGVTVGYPVSTRVPDA